ncbi:MAG TPA: hypothetical protein VGJ04_02805 [Pirellulales bacterium]
MRNSVWLLWVIVAAGCSGENTAARVADLNRSNIQKAANLYSAYQMHNGVGPKDAATLKEFVSSGSGISPRRLEMMQIDLKNLDPIFISERDHKPFKLKPNVLAPSMTIAAVVFEDIGIDGKRQVAFNNGSVREVDDAKYKNLWENKDAELQRDPEAEAAAKKSG